MATTINPIRVHFWQVGFFFLLTGTCIYNEIGGQLPWVFYPSEEQVQEENERMQHKRKQRRLSTEIETGSFDELGIDANPASPKADDWFSPKLTHYTQGRA